jgi:tape measure domain-containing protein
MSAQVPFGLDGSKMKQGLDKLRGDVSSWKKSIMDMFSTAAGIGMFAGISAGLSKIKSLFSRPIELAMDFETAMVSMEVLTGSIEGAKQVLSDFQKVAANTPFETAEIIDAGKKLLAFGFSAKTVGNELMRLADLSAGVGAPIGELAELYGKARVQGTLFAEDINQLTGRGIPVIQEFAKVLGVSTDEVKKMASEGKVTFGELQQAFENLTSKGGKFADMSAKQSGTLAGLWSTFKSELDEVFKTLGKPIVDWLKPIVGGWIDKVKEFGATLTGAIKAGNVWETLASGFDLIIERVKNGLSLAVDEMLNKLRGTNAGQMMGLGEAEYKAFNYKSPELEAAERRFEKAQAKNRPGIAGNAQAAASAAVASGSEGTAADMITGVDKARAEFEKKRIAMAYEEADVNGKLLMLAQEKADLEAKANDQTVAGVEAKIRLLEVTQSLADLEKEKAEVAAKAREDEAEEASRLEAEREAKMKKIDDLKAKDGSSLPSILVSELASIGGGGNIAKGIDPSLREAIQQTRLLAEIAAILSEGEQQTTKNGEPIL